MAKKSTTKVYGFKATPMREQFKRERELLMRQIRRYEKKGYVFDSSVQVPSKERAGQRITKSYIAKLQAMRKGLADVAYRVNIDGELISTAREDTHFQRGVHAQSVKRQKAFKRREDEYKRAMRNAPGSEFRNPLEPPPPQPDDDSLIEHTAPPEEFDEYEPEPEHEPQYGPGKSYSEMPNISDVIIKNYIDQFSEFAFGASGEGARTILSGIRNLMREHGKEAVAKAITKLGYNYGVREVSYNPEIAGAALKAIKEFITGQRDDTFESDGGYWPGDDLYE